MKKKMQKIYDAVNELLSKANHDEDTKYQEDTTTCFNQGRVDALEEVLLILDGEIAMSENNAFMDYRYPTGHDVP